MAIKSIHLVGIGGVGMAGLAVLLKSRGYSVSGCDLKATARTQWLEAQGIPVQIGHSPHHLIGVDAVIVTPAVSQTEPELLNAPSIRYRGEVLAELVSASEGIVVCGSHGKTTTSTWIAKLLRALGEDVSWCIGGETGDFPVAGVGTGALVVEADESDGTLALYHSKLLVINKCDYDHPDHFKSEADYFACYESARRQAEEIIESEQLPPRQLDCLKDLPEHNRKNACAAIEVALRRGHSLDSIAAVLPQIVSELPDRRFQLIWPAASAAKVSQTPRVYTDYAHHPTEMRNAVQMARQKCRGRLFVLFQPHRYSRTKALLADFPAAFEGADEVVLCPTYAAFEQPIEGGDIADLYCQCRRGTSTVRYFLARTLNEAWEHAFNSAGEEDVVLVLGAGNIIDLVPRICDDLRMKSKGESCARRQIWIGQGSNTWRSDLRLAVDYVRTTGPANLPGASLGIPWMAGVPGTIGGWIKMNAGAFGHEISELLSEVKIDGQWVPATACGFSYRHSSITGEIQDFHLKEGACRACTESAADFLARRPKFPAGTFGSFFKNPSGDFAGRLLEQAGAKDLCVGGAFVWASHANVIVRGEGATPSDVLALARLMRNRVLFRFGIALEPEVCGITF